MLLRVEERRWLSNKLSIVNEQLSMFNVPLGEYNELRIYEFFLPRTESG